MKDAVIGDDADALMAHADQQPLALPHFLEVLDDEWFVPTWRTMDGGEPRVYAIDFEASEKAHRPLLEDGY